MSHHVTRPSKSSDIRSGRTFFRSGLPGLMTGPIRWRYSKRHENDQSNFGIITEVKSDWSTFWPIKIKTWPTMASSLPEFELNLKFPFPCVGMYESNFTGIVHGCSTIGSSEINNFILYFPHKCPSNWNFWNIGKFFLSGIFLKICLCQLFNLFMPWNHQKAPPCGLKMEYMAHRSSDSFTIGCESWFMTHELGLHK